MFEISELITRINPRQTVLLHCANATTLSPLGTAWLEKYAADG